MRKACQRRILIKTGRSILAAILAFALAFSGVYAGPVCSYAEPEQDVYEALKEDLSDNSGAEYKGYIIELKEDASDAAEEAVRKGVADGAIKDMPDTPGCCSVKSLSYVKKNIPEDDIDHLEPDYKVYLAEGDSLSEGEGFSKLLSATEPDDELYLTDQYNIRDLNIPAVWGYGMEGQDQDEKLDKDNNGIPGDDDIVIAVIDSGLKEDHEDIDPDSLAGGVDLSGSSEFNTIDRNGHGTSVTGIIAAKKDNAKGIAGILQRVKIHTVRTFDGGTTSNSAVVNGINYCAKQKELFGKSKGKDGLNISVINLSLVTDGASVALKAACERAMSQGIILVCAAGNKGSGLTDDTPVYPAQYTMGVGSVNKKGSVSSFSARLSAKNGDGYENKVWVAVPGEGIATPEISDEEPYASKSGTSFSCPHVSALAALCKAIRNDMSQAQFMQLLKETAVSKTSGSGTIAGQDRGYGWGTLDFKKTIDTLLGKEYEEPAEEDTSGNEGESGGSGDNGSGDGEKEKAEAISKVKGVKTEVKVSKRRISVAFSGVKGATDYQVAWRTGGTGKWKKKKTGGKTEYTIKKLKKGKIYDVRVRAVRSGSEYGPWSAVKYRYMKAVKARYKAKGRTIRASWKKIKKASGYRVYYSLKKNMEDPYVGIVRKAGVTRVIITGLMKGKAYYLITRPYKVKKGHVYLGASKKKRARVR